MKVGDFVAWSDTWDDETRARPAGLVLKAEFDVDADIFDESRRSNPQFLILMQHNGELSWEFRSDLEVMFESR